jgi:hypothetical protein
MKRGSLGRWVTWGVLGCPPISAPAAEESASPWRLGRAEGRPSWLAGGGKHRIRYETLDGQFRARRTGGDQALALRTSLAVELRTNPVQLLSEMLDARQCLSDSGSPLDTTMVNALEVLQAHLRWKADDLIPGGTNTLRIGRETLDLGSRRLAARNAFRNTINSFTGADWLWAANGGGSVRAFWYLPGQRLPADFDSLLDNKIVADTQGFGQQFWGVYGNPANLGAWHPVRSPLAPPSRRRGRRQPPAPAAHACPAGLPESQARSGRFLTGGRLPVRRLAGTGRTDRANVGPRRPVSACRRGIHV